MKLKKFSLLVVLYLCFICNGKMLIAQNAQWVIFDFDGTLADTLSLAIEYYNKSASILGCKQIETEEDIQAFRSRTILDNIKSNFSLWNLFSALRSLPQLVSGSTTFFEENADRVALFNEVNDLLGQLAAKYNLAIITAGSTKVIAQTLEKNGLSAVVEGIYSDGFSLFSGKEVTINKFLTAHNLNCDDVVFIGDEADDVYACRKAGVKIISVTWGYNSSELLQQAEPDCLVDSFAELASAIDLVSSY